MNEDETLNPTNSTTTPPPGGTVEQQLAAEKEAKEAVLKQARDARRTVRRQARDQKRSALTQTLGLIESDPNKLILVPRRCVWRDSVGMGNGLVDMLERQQYEDARAGNAGIKRRSFIPVAKLTGLVGYWLGLYYTQTRAFQKAVASKVGPGSGSGSAESMAAPLLPDVVIRDRLKASKGKHDVVETYLDILVRSIVQFKYVPRIYLFGLLCGLYPEEGYGGYAPSSGLVFVAAIRQVMRDSPSFDLGSLTKATTIWIAGIVAESVIRVLFADDHWWTMKLWGPDCKHARIKPMWSDEAARRSLTEDMKETMSQVGNIEPKDRRALPPELKTAGFNARVCDLDKYLCALLTTWLEQRRGVMERLDVVEMRRLEKESSDLEMKRIALHEAQDRPFSKEEVRYLKLGVKRHGIGYWADMLRDNRLIFVHRTVDRLEHEWHIITHRRERREQRRWDWRRWPWNPEWEWGALQVVPASMMGNQGSGSRKKDRQETKGGMGDEAVGAEDGEDQYREDWGVWDDMDITDDEKDKTLVQSSSDNTATDDSDENNEYYATQEQKANGGGNNNKRTGEQQQQQQQQQQAGAPGLLGAILQKVAMPGHIDSPISSDRGLMHSVNEADDENDEDEHDPDNNGSIFMTSSLRKDSLSHNTMHTNDRHVQSQPTLPGVFVPGPSRSMAKSQSAVLHLGHYQFGDKTAQALSQTLQGGNDQASLGRDPGSRNRTNLDPGSKAIDTLVLRDNGMTSSGFVSLSMTLKGNSNITSLDLRRNKLGIKGITALSKVLQSFTCKMKYIDLDSTGIDDRGFLQLANALSQRASRSLLPNAVDMVSDTEENNEGGGRDDDGTGSPETANRQSKKKKKKDSEKENKIDPLPSCLVEIHLGHNMISDASSVALDDMLGSLPQLTHLDLSWNRLKGKSAQVLANRICNARNCKLSVLNVQFNRIGDYGACVLLQPLYGMSTTPHLEVLDLSFNGIHISNHEVLNHTISIVSQARTLKSLQMNGNEMLDEDFQSIRFALEESSHRKTGSLVVGLESSAVAIVGME
jgi:hypothetical protein